jgi:dolichol-phosphate mannosyltransferase
VSECVLGGLAYATGDAAVYMDADLQDPPEVIPELVARWRAGAEVVYTVRVSRAGESPFKLWATRLAYKIISALSDTPLPVEAGDFRLLSRRAVRQLLQFRERRPYLRGLVTWMGFRQAAVSYTRERRFAGDGHFPLLASKGPMLMFLAGVLSFSYIPLSFFAVLGSLVTLGALAALVVALVGGLLGSDVGGAFVLLAVGALLSGVQLLGIGVLGLYLSRVLDEVRNRPQFIVESVIGFD